jgi:hypothetical protein
MTILLLTPCLLAGQGKGQGKGQAKEHGREAAQAEPAARPKETYPFFHDAETKLILDFYRPGSGHLPPGLAKRGGALPPGLQKQLRVTGTLPPGIEKHLEPFPADLDRRLGPVPAGYRRVLAGTTALLVQDATNLIVDVLELIRR